MCTVILGIGLREDFPVILGANRDEMLARPWEKPAAHWPEQHRGVVGGRDTLAGGTWLALNRHGVVAAVLNRHGSLGPAPGKRSRGELPLVALAAGTASEAAMLLARLDAGAFRPFNLILADARDAFFIRGMSSGNPELRKLAPGHWMTTAHDPNDLSSPRIARHLPRLRAAAVPDPARDDFSSWIEVLADTSAPVESAINIAPTAGFGTVSSCLLALPRSGAAVFKFAPGRPHETIFQHVEACRR